MTAAALARIGQMMLDRGAAADGRRVISEHWLEQSTQPTPGEPQVGFLWWMLRQDAGLVAVDRPIVGFAAHGNDGQKLSVFPALGVVAVRLCAHRPGMRAGGPQTFHGFERMVQAVFRTPTAAPTTP
jgi:CubicO group peptidase (beta-lactamase class C family)